MLKEVENAFLSFGIKGKAIREEVGPTIQRVEFLPNDGIKLNKILGVADDIARVLAVKSVRIDTLEDSQCVGVEIPRKERKTVDFQEVFDKMPKEKDKLNILLGVDIVGTPVVADLAKMPHLLVAGTTGSGKSVGLNCFLVSLLKQFSPDELKLVLLDAKKVEFSIYNNLKYLFCPVVSEFDKMIEVLEKIRIEMENRYFLLEKEKVRNIQAFNKKNPDSKLPYIVVVVDEFADIMLNSGRKAESIIQSLAQKARAAGIHLIIATQRPSVDVVTGVIKANFPSRLSYRVANSFDSKTILDKKGAESLLGCGDAIYQNNCDSIRVQSPYISDDELDSYIDSLEKIEVEKEEEEKPKVVKKDNKNLLHLANIIFYFFFVFSVFHNPTPINALKMMFFYLILAPVGLLLLSLLLSFFKK